MLNIIVCMKQVPDSEIYEGKDSSVNRTEAALIMNTLDKYALSEAIKLNKTYGGTIKTLSMGPMKSSEVLKEVIAVGVDECILVTGDELKGADTYATALVLSKAIKKIEKYDLVIVGNKSIDGNTGQVGPSLAEFLSIPHITNVTQIKQINGEDISVQKKTERGYIDIVLPLPAVLCVTEEVCEIKHPTIWDIVNNHGKKVKYWGMEDIEVDKDEIGYRGSKTKVTHAYKVYEASKKGCEFITLKKERNEFQKIIEGMI